MPSNLIERMIARQGYPLIDEASAAEFLANHHEVVLFFTEDPARFPESNDVAMILPELVSHYQQRFAVAVVSQQAQRSLQLKFDFSQWPTLVFFRDGVRLGSISRVQNWGDYIRQIDELLSKQTQGQIPLVQLASTTGAAS